MERSLIQRAFTAGALTIFCVLTVLSASSCGAKQTDVFPDWVKVEWENAEKLGENEYQLEVGQTATMRLETPPPDQGDSYSLQLMKFETSKSGILLRNTTEDSTTVTAEKPGMVTLSCIPVYRSWQVEEDREYPINVVFHVVEKGGARAESTAEFEISVPDKPYVGMVMQAKVEGIPENQQQFGTWSIAYETLSGEPLKRENVPYSNVEIKLGSPITADGSFVAYMPCVATVTYTYETKKKSVVVRFEEDADFTVSLLPKSATIEVGEVFYVTPVFTWNDPDKKDVIEGGDRVLWWTEDSRLIGVSQEGRVTGRAPGETYVELWLYRFNEPYSYRSARIPVTVVPKGEKKGDKYIVRTDVCAAPIHGAGADTSAASAAT